MDEKTKQSKKAKQLKSYSDYFTSKVNRMRRQLGLKELVCSERKCLRCSKNFSGIQGIEFMCYSCRKFETSDFEC
jgi:hypothetical protein